MNSKFALLLVLASATSFAAIEPTKKPALPSKQTLPADTQAPRWMLQDFLKISASNPAQLLRMAAKMFSKDRLRVTTLEPRYVHDWQNRLAMVQAISDIFDPSGKRVNKAAAKHRAYARKVLVYAMMQDPSLIVRDGVVESVRRIMRMRPQERYVWKKPLEAAFLNKQNFDRNGGLFIRETILTALREGSIRPSVVVIRAAKNDKNPRVKGLLREWDTKAYDTL